MKYDDKIHSENTSCHMRVEDVDGLYEEMKAAGVVHANGPLKKHPWKICEFAVLDLDVTPSNSEKIYKICS